jgi:hypothetical protein
VARNAGLRWQGLTFAYLVLRRDARSLASRHPGALRVVSRPLVTKGKRELDLCGEAGLMRVVRLDRDQREANAAYDAAARGAILAIVPSPTPRTPPGPVRLGKETEVDAQGEGS